MQIMECRQAHLAAEIRAHEQDQTPPLIMKSEEGVYSPAGYPDDLGMYYFVPLISKSFHLPLNSSLHLFFGTMAGSSALITLIFFFLLFKSWKTRLYITISTLLFFSASFIKCFDVYLASLAIPALLIPPLIYMGEKKTKGSFSFFLLMGIAGILMGYSNFIRIHSGTGMLCFIFLWLLLNETLSIRAKLASISIVALTFTLPYWHFHSLEKNRDQFLTEASSKVMGKVQHPKWHNIYIGFGFLDNPYGIAYSDTISYKKVQSICPEAADHLNEKYEAILKNECLHLFFKDPLFVIQTVLYKGLVILLKALFCFNFGLLSFAIMKIQWKGLIPFLFSAIFYSLPGLATMPFTAYVLGSLTLCAIYGIYFTATLIEKRAHSATNFQKILDS